MLIVVVGNSISAAALIIAVFMGGLGLGSYFGGRAFGARRPSLVPYLLLELAIGVYVVLSPALFRLLSGFFTSMAPVVADRTALSLIRLIVTMAALMIPSLLMGATFPAMINGATLDQPGVRGARIGYLYSVNTLGAAIGCFAAGYHLLLEFGVQTALFCALGLYLVAAICAFLAHTLRARESGEPSTAPAGELRPSSKELGLRRFLWAATFGIGFVSLAYEVLLTRLSILYLGNSVSVFPLVLTAFLLGTGASAIAGTWLYGRLRRSGEGADRLFGVTALMAGIFVLFTPRVLLGRVSAERFAQLADAAPGNPWPLLGIIVLPTFLIGGLLPIAIRMLQGREQGPATRGAASLYALNTAGGLIGAAVANHYLVPSIGVHGVLLLLGGICFAAGLAQLFPPGRSARRWVIVGGVVVLVTGALWAGLPRMEDLYARKVAQSTGAESAHALLVREGRAATVTVIDQSDPGQGSYRDMYLNGVEEASTRYWHTQLFKLLGILPVLIHDSEGPKDVLVIAFGAGITAGSVLASDDVASLDVVDLNPDIEGINGFFTDVNGDVYHQPRFHFHNDDGRNYLVTSGKEYDLIISDSTHPRAYDSWILYTDEFYQSVRRRLRPGGIFAQWVPVLGSMQGDLFRIHLNTFRQSFPHSSLWYVYGSDQAFLMATPESLSLDAGLLQKKLDSLPGWFQADSYQIDSVARVAGFFWLDEEAMQRMIGDETRLNRDGVHYFDKQAAVVPSPPHRRLPAYQTSILPYLVGSADGLRSAVGGQQAVAQLLARYGFYRSKEDLYRAYCLMPENGNVRYFMDREFSEQLPEWADFCRERELAQYRSAVAQRPNDPLALNALADLLIAGGELDEAMPLAERALSLDPGNGMILDTYGWGLLKRGENRKALEVLRESASVLPEHPVVLFHLGAAYRAIGDAGSARKYLEAALTSGSGFAGAEAAEARRMLEESR
jgi:spermidine synthase